jgi:RNA polymerase sigma factor (TIGR02999 family)
MSTFWHCRAHAAILFGMPEVTQILSQIEQGNPQAADGLLPLVYDELRKLAAARLAHENPGQTLQATALIHEAYLRLIGNDDSFPWDNRGHFFAAAAEAMRRILIETARRKLQIGRGGDLKRVSCDDLDAVEDQPREDLLALDESLTRLEVHDPLAAGVVKLRYFAGLTMSEVAAALGISLRKAERNWTYARTWLQRDLN